MLVAPYRHPIVLGKVLATIEQFAPGRLLCGLGSGWMREEFDALGVPFAGRGVRMDEYVAALRTIWSGTPAAFEGTVYRWEAAGFNPAPTGPIPILLGGHVAPARARALRLGDGWATILTALDDPSLAGSLAWLQRVPRASSRRPDATPRPTSCWSASSRWCSPTGPTRRRPCQARPRRSPRRCTACATRA